MELIWGQYWFKESGLGPEKSTQRENKVEEVIEESKKLFCTACKNYISDLDSAISINDAQSHTFTNPAGHTYNIDCFHSAPGCQIMGDATEEYTWFTNYAWQVALCNKCKEHLGWYYSHHNTFFGLISDRLTHLA